MLLSNILQTTKCFTHTPKYTIPQLKQINTDSGRFYKSPSGALYPSATTVVGMLSRDSIKKWRKQVGETEANRVSSKAAQRGTRVHQLCEDYLNNQFDLEKHSKFSIYDLESFVRLKEQLDNIDNIHLQEERLYSDFLKMAGTVDCVGEYCGKLSIIDFKTSRKLKEKDYILGYFCQATAYAIMFEELTGISVPRITIIISVDDEPTQVFTEYRDNYVDRLLAVRKLYEDEFGF